MVNLIQFNLKNLIFKKKEIWKLICTTWALCSPYIYKFVNTYISQTSKRVLFLNCSWHDDGVFEILHPLLLSVKLHHYRNVFFWFINYSH
jgi:hypothetical protein